MAIITTSAGDYAAQRFAYFVAREGNIDHIYSDTRGLPTLGIGYLMLARVNGNGPWQIRPDAVTTLASPGIAVTLVQTDLDRLTAIADYLNGNPPNVGAAIAYTGGAANSGQNFFSFTLDATQRRALFDVVIPSYEATVTAALGSSNANFAGSLERIALVSLAYNLPEAISPGSALAGYLRAGNRAAAWFEIRYRSDSTNGLTNRRNAESDEFGLFNSHSNSSFTDREAIDSLGYIYSQMAVNAHKGRTADVMAAIGSAKNYIQNTYAAGNAIDRVISASSSGGTLSDTTGRDVVFGLENSSSTFRLASGGADYAYGGSASDSFYSIDGHDAMHGSGGGDVFYLAGGQSFAYGDAGDDYFYVSGNNNSAYGGLNIDQFIVNSSNSTFDGGDGDDIFSEQSGSQNTYDGGYGFDRYYLQGGQNDTVIDADGSGFVALGSLMLTGGARQESSNVYGGENGGATYEWSGGDLVVNGTLTIANFNNGDLGINLTECNAPNGLGCQA